MRPRPTPQRRTAAVLAAALLVPLPGCGGGDEEQVLRVLAAASLTDVFEQLAAEFEADHEGVDVQLSFGSSTDLAEQAVDGAPGDVLATADRAAMQIAEEGDVAADPAAFATNVLVIATPPGNPAGVGSLADLAGTTWVRCADEAPCGKVGAAVLEAQGIQAEPASLEEDARSTLDKVVSGEADAALVYASDARSAGEEVETVGIDEAEDHRTTYFAAPLEQSGDAGLAREWIELLTGVEGQQALAAAGFGAP